MPISATWAPCAAIVVHTQEHLVALNEDVSFLALENAIYTSIEKFTRLFTEGDTIELPNGAILTVTYTPPKA